LLEFDHCEAFAVGGDETVDNLRLRRRSHNALEAEKLFGRSRMASASEPQRPRSRETIWSKQDGKCIGATTPSKPRSYLVEAGWQVRLQAREHERKGQPSAEIPHASRLTLHASHFATGKACSSPLRSPLRDSARMVGAGALVTAFRHDTHSSRATHTCPQMTTSRCQSVALGRRYRRSLRTAATHRERNVDR
ncbi:MAG TPA: hypothetical protein VIV60_18480, partial [Polyangiaceae bacterium]